MNFGMHIERTLNGRRIEPGAEFPEPFQQLRFQIVVICDSVNPDKWHGEVRLGPHAVITTSSYDSYEQAGRQAKNAYEAKIVEIFQR
ncbi:hypothetical protein GCM10008944_13500 [Cytobacillus oceanisediminis]